MISLLKERLYSYLNENNLLNKWQAGFRPEYRTSDQTYILKTLINKYLHIQKKRLYVCFVDFQKAFDLVWHEGLFYKMLKLGVGGNLYSLIKNMYQNFHLRIKSATGLSKLIKAAKGVRQGDGISPLLFNLFVNDLPYIFMTPEGHPPKLDTESVPCLLYADDIVII